MDIRRIGAIALAGLLVAVAVAARSTPAAAFEAEEEWYFFANITAPTAWYFQAAPGGNAAWSVYGPYSSKEECFAEKSRVLEEMKDAGRGSGIVECGQSDVVPDPSGPKGTQYGPYSSEESCKAAQDELQQETEAGLPRYKITQLCHPPTMGNLMPKSISIPIQGDDDAPPDENRP
jgi:hypothetical protein